MSDSMDSNKLYTDIKYIPPLVSGNKLAPYFNASQTLSEANLEVGGYIRISTNKDSQITSIENQKKYLSQWAEINGYNIKGFYIDVKSGAYTHLRNEMNRLREDIRIGKVKGIISKEISRTSRDIMDILELKRSLSDSGAFFISIKENYDSRTDDDEFLLVIHAGLAQKERKMTSSRVKITQLIKAKEGKTNVPVPAYGYKLSEDRQHLIIDSKKAEVYWFIVDKYLDGWGQLRICKYLNQNNIQTSRNKKWHTNSLKTLLTNPVYLGVTIYNATTIIRDSKGNKKRVVRPYEDWIIREGTHKALISEEKFNKIQSIIKERSMWRYKAWSSQKKYLLSGVLVCSVCKGKIYGFKMLKKNCDLSREYHYYYVDQNREGECDTKTKYWRMDKVENEVFKQIKSLFSNEEGLCKIINEKASLLNVKMINIKKEYDAISIRIDNINSAINKQQEAYECNATTLEEYRDRMLTLRNEKEYLHGKISGINDRLCKYGLDESLYIAVKKKVLGYIKNIDLLEYNLKEYIIKKIIKIIILNKDYTIDIVYNYDEG